MYRKRGKKSLKPNKEIFESMYYNPSMTTYEIAEFYGVSIRTIYNWANQFRKEEEIQWGAQKTARQFMEGEI